MKVLLVSTNTVTRPYSVYPLGLDHVIDSIAHRHEVKSVDLNGLPGGEQDLKAAVREFRPDVIGLSIRNIDNIDEANTETFVDSARRLVDGIRRCSEAVIVLGGSGFTIMPREFMAALDADFGVVGEGERFPLLLEALERNSKGDVRDIPGVVVKDCPAQFPAPLPDLPGLGALPETSYRELYIRKGGMLNMQTKRGCPFQCVYCTYPLIEGTSFRCLQPEVAARHARMLQEAGAKYIYIADSTFNGSYEHSLEVALAFRQEGVSIPWGGFFTPTPAPPDYYRKLAEAGLKHVEFGTESLSDEVLAAYKKPFRVKSVLESHRLAVEAGLHVAHYLMPGGPGENEATLRDSLQNCDKLEKTVFFIFGGVRIYPHTGLFEIALREEQVKAGSDFLKPAFYWSPALDRDRAVEIIRLHAAGRTNWIIGSGASGMYRMMERLHAWGHVGPLWERLVK